MILRRIGLVLALLASAPVAAAGGDDPAAYALRVPVTAAAGASLQRLSLPARVLVAARSPQLADVRIFDAAGQAVPIALAPPTQPQQRQETALPLLPILGPQDALAVTGVSLRIDEQQRASVVRVDGTPQSGGATRLLGILLDTRHIVDPLAALALDVATPAGQPVTIAVESSADLKDWRPLADKVIYHTGPQQTRETIDLPPSVPHDRYLRVTWHAASRLLSEVTVRAASVVTMRRRAPSAPRVVLAVDTMPDRHAIEFTLPFPAAISALEFGLAGADTVVPVRILGRDQGEEPWTPITSGALFRVTDAGRSRTNAAFDLHGTRFRSLRVEADARSAGFGATPTIAARLEPAQVVFLATGRPPFTLATGKADAPSAFLRLDDLLQAQGSQAAALPSASIATGADPVVQVAAADRALPWRRIALWGMLLLATALLAAMVWRLTRRSAPAA